MICKFILLAAYHILFHMASIECHDTWLQVQASRADRILDLILDFYIGNVGLIKKKEEERKENVEIERY